MWSIGRMIPEDTETLEERLEEFFEYLFGKMGRAGRRAAVGNDLRTLLLSGPRNTVLPMTRRLCSDDAEVEAMRQRLQQAELARTRMLDGDNRQAIAPLARAAITRSLQRETSGATMGREFSVEQNRPRNQPTHRITRRGGKPQPAASSSQSSGPLHRQLEWGGHDLSAAAPVHGRTVLTRHLRAAVLVVAWSGLAGCSRGAPAPTRATPPTEAFDAPVRSLSEDSAPHPLALTPVLIEFGMEYMATQGQEVEGLAAPWAGEEAAAGAIDLERAAALLGIDGEPQGQHPVVLTSPRVQTAAWRFVTSATARIYEVRKVRVSGSDGEWVVLLAADRPPEGQIIDTFSATWTVLLWSPSRDVASTVSLRTEIPQRTPAMWDSISTSLEIVDGGIWVEISYAHSGDGAPCEQTFDYWVKAQSGPELVIDHTEQKLTACP